MATREIVKPGPTVLVTTWTKLPGPEMSTRLLILKMHDDGAQIAASLRAQADLELGGKAPEPPPELVAFQQYLQTLAPIRVFVPYAAALGDLMGRTASSSRVRRDFGKLLSLIKAVAIIRAFHRQRDNMGRIIADIADYATIRDLTNDVFTENNSHVEDDVRQLVNAVATMETVNPDQVISITAMAKHLNTYPMNISRLAKRAIESGWLINVNNQRGRPAQLKILNALPVEVGLPSVDEINRLYDQKRG